MDEVENKYDLAYKHDKKLNSVSEGCRTHFNLKIARKLSLRIIDFFTLLLLLLSLSNS